MLNTDPSTKPVPSLEIPTNSAKYKRLSIGPPTRKRFQEKRYSDALDYDISESISKIGRNALSTNLTNLPGSFYNKKSNLEPFELTKSKLFNPPHADPALYFRELSNKGYDHLTQVLQNETHYPFQQLMSVSFPELIEGLLDLHLLIEKKEGMTNKGSGEDILIFAINAAQKCTPSDFLETRWMLGKLLYLTEQNFVRTTERIKLENIEENQDWIRLQFDLEMMKVQHRLIHYVENQEAAGLQNSKQCSKTQLAIELSKIIVTELGTINSGIITPLLQLFIKDMKNPLNHDISLIYGLGQIENKPGLRNQFLRIRAPTPKTPADVITRIAMGYPHNTELTEVDARKTVLSGLISRLRQSPSGSCFATCWTIELMSCQITQCLRDFIEIMSSSKLTRKVNQQPVDFPFLLTANCKSLETEFWVDAFGKLRTSDETTYIWDAPGIIAACQAMGIMESKEIILKILSEYFHDKKNAGRYKPLTIDELLRLLADWSNEHRLMPDDHAISLFRKGSFAYDSQSSNPILNVWMNSIAGMSEAISSSMIKSHMISAVTGSLDFLEKTLSVSTSNKIKLSVYSKMFTQLSKRIRLEYDPSIKGNPHDGAFVLYDKGSLSLSRGWTRIDNPQLFQQFIIQIIDIARQNISLTILNDHTIDMLDVYISKLKGFVMTNDFLTKLIQIYDPVYGARENNLESLLKLPYTPWITRCGNDTAKTLQVYLERSNPPILEKYIPSSPEDLLLKVIDLGKKTYAVDDSYLKNPLKLISLRIPGVHAFSLMLGHPTVSPACRSPLHSSDWIKQNLVEHGKKVALSEVGPQLHHLIMQHCLSQIVSKEGKEKFSRQLKHLSDKASIISFRNRVLEYMQVAAPVEAMAQKERMIKLDTYLCQNLPQSSKYQIEKTAIHFADTNFACNEHDVHYCFMFNPGSGQVEIWEALDNGAFLTALDQSICNFQTWEFCKNPNEILPENEKLEI